VNAFSRGGARVKLEDPLFVHAFFFKLESVEILPIYIEAWKDEAFHLPVHSFSSVFC
jgi:hypothetical protein